ncbi:MAG: VOC family protein [Candidatus Eremiobacteraeota bacterium]|nr:VOC family protein [Candidatus Eremiobacteraeota bacterium]
MLKVEPYLHFSGNCEEALTAYAAIFGGTIGEVNRYAGSPMQEQVPEGWGQKVMHTAFSAPGVDFMASDSPHRTLAAGSTSRVALSIASPDASDGKRIFDALAEGGTVTMPYSKQFWGASFGMLTDRFGIDWLVNAG